MRNYLLKEVQEMLGLAKVIPKIPKYFWLSDYAGRLLHRTIAISMHSGWNLVS